jgi:hypothetical protein
MQRNWRARRGGHVLAAAAACEWKHRGKTAQATRCSAQQHDVHASHWYMGTTAITGHIRLPVQDAVGQTQSTANMTASRGAVARRNVRTLRACCSRIPRQASRCSDRRRAADRCTSPAAPNSRRRAGTALHNAEHSQQRQARERAVVTTLRGHARQQRQHVQYKFAARGAPMTAAVSKPASIAPARHPKSRPRRPLCAHGGRACRPRPQAPAG